MNTLKLNISTPDGDAFAGEVAKLDLRGIEGELAVMAGHVPFLTAVKPGHCDIMLPDGEEKKAVIDGGYDPVYGARPLKRYLQKYVETLSARLILSGTVGEGDTIEIYVDGAGQLKAQVKK